MTQINISTQAQGVLPIANGGTGNSSGYAAPYPIMILAEQYASGTAAQTASAAAWNVRHLNTVILNNIAGASLNASTYKVTLPAGTYEFNGVGQAFTIGKTRLKIYNETLTTDIFMGCSQFTANDASYGDGTPAELFGAFILTSTTDITLQQYATNVQQFGYSSGITGIVEIYAQIMIKKVA